MTNFACPLLAALGLPLHRIHHFLSLKLGHICQVIVHCHSLQPLAIFDVDPALTAWHRADVELEILIPLGSCVQGVHVILVDKVVVLPIGGHSHRPSVRVSVLFHLFSFLSPSFLTIHPDEFKTDEWEKENFNAQILQYQILQCPTRIMPDETKYQYYRTNIILRILLWDENRSPTPLHYFRDRKTEGGIN